MHLFTRANLDGAQHLINAVMELTLQMALPKGLPTLHDMALGNHMRPDNVFMSALLHSSVVKCTKVLEEWPVMTDHLPIVIVANLAPEIWTETLRPKYRLANWEEFRKILSGGLVGLEVKEI